MNDLHYAVVVGVNRYPAVSSLTSPKRDAESFAGWLKRSDGGDLPESNVKIITVPDDQMPDNMPRENARPTSNEIHLALQAHRLACKARVEADATAWPKTRLYVYVSGHGLAPNPREAALLMADAGPEWFGLNFPCNGALEFFLRAQTFREIVILADCCRYQADDAELAILPFGKPKGNNGRVTKMLGLATTFGDPAYEPPPLPGENPDDRRSYFTKALLEGLNGAAADPATGTIDSNSLAKFVRAKTRDLTKNRRPPQDPVVETDPADPIVFRTGRAPVPCTVNITFTTPFYADVYLLDGNHGVVERHAMNGGVWQAAVPKSGLYRVHPADGANPAAPEAANPFARGGVFSAIGEVTDVEL